MEITKMHGLGNDFIVIDNREGAAGDAASLARRLCHRRLGVGADGLLLLEDAEQADARMRIINADGSEAEMCGNGIRCFARYFHDRFAPDREEYAFATLAGIMRPRLEMKDGRVAGIRVDMGAPSFDRGAIPMAGEGSPLNVRLEAAGQTVTAHCVLMGVPHMVVPCDSVDDIDFAHLGPALEAHPQFPRKVNVNFVELTGPNTVRVRTWERGAGSTMACGTGACATAVVLNELGLTGPAVDIQLEAGCMHIERTAQTVYMTGPAEYVFVGELLSK